VSSNAWMNRLVITSCIGILTTGAAAQDLPLRDPMRPYSIERSAERATQVARPRVSAILISTVRRIAVIDGETYAEGDVFAGAEIVRIEPRSVHLRRGDRELVMALLESAPSQEN
jgi:hypothetical protein